MSVGVSSTVIEEFSKFVAEHLGLHFPHERLSDLERGIKAAARELGYEDEEKCVRWLMSAPLTKAQIELLAGNLTVGETYFFREEHTFEALEHQVLPELIRARQEGERRLRLWSAGCCTGEEAYSLAILIDRLLPDLADWNVTILATDLNPRFLRKAAQGVFREWSFRNAPAWLRDRYFKVVGDNQFSIAPSIRRMVTFEYLNLARDIYPSLLNDTNAMDLILCRNVLMYFSADQAGRVAEGLSGCLIEGGWLAMSSTETPLPPTPDLLPIPMDGSVLYRKLGREPAPTPSASRPQQFQRGSNRPSAPAEQPAAQTRIVRELANEGRLAEALASAEGLVAIEKLNPSAHYLRAMILLEQGSPADASEALNRAIHLDHRFVLAHFALGNLAANAGRSKEADGHFNNALRILREHGQDDILPESDGLTAGRLAEIIAATLEEEPT